MKAIVAFLLFAVGSLWRCRILPDGANLGNRTVSVPGNLPSTTKVQQSFPSCTHDGARCVE